MKKPTQSNTDVIRPWYFNRWLIRCGIGFCVVLVGLGLFAWYAYRAAQVVPEYYEALLQQPMEDLHEAGDQFESEILELQNSAIELGQWQAVFTQDQINGWLASDLPQKFPKALPASITNPRVALEDDELKLIFRFDSKRLSGIVEASADAFCTDDINQVAIRVNHIRSGVLSLPLSAWTDKIGNILMNNGCPTRWAEQDGDTIALVGLPRKVSDREDQKLVIESIEVLDGKIILNGVTMDPGDIESYRQAKKSSAETDESFR